MEAIELIKGRRSIRKYRAEKVSREDIEKIMDATRFAPSWANYQIARYTVIQDEEKIAKLCADGVQDFIYNVKTLKYAKNVMVLSFVKGKSGRFEENGDFVTTMTNAWESFDAGIACQTFCLAAHAYGVGTCIMGVIDNKVISDVANLPENETVSALITFGYPIENPNPTPRYEVADILRYE